MKLKLSLYEIQSRLCRTSAYIVRYALRYSLQVRVHRRLKNGEVNRTNSGGPDIFRYKYTGQEEDPETGLYYYKARYYDPAIGRFIQADTVINPESIFGMNQYMYV
jgi:RHS repeat-associated protein